MKLALPKIKITYIILSIRYFYAVVALIITAVVCLLSWFIYNNLYLTITRAQTIVILKQEVAPDTINLVLINSVLEKIDKKIANPPALNLQSIRNPFGAVTIDQTSPPNRID